MNVRMFFVLSVFVRGRSRLAVYKYGSFNVFLKSFLIELIAIDNIGKGFLRIISLSLFIIRHKERKGKRFFKLSFPYAASPSLLSIAECHTISRQCYLCMNPKYLRNWLFSEVRYTI